MYMYAETHKTYLYSGIFHPVGSIFRNIHGRNKELVLSSLVGKHLIYYMYIIRSHMKCGAYICLSGLKPPYMNVPTASHSVQILV